MSLPLPAHTHRSAAPPPAPRFTDLLRSEWVKLRTVRTTVWCLAATALTSVGAAVLVAVKARSQGPRTIDVTVNFSHLGIMVGQLAVIVLAVTAIGSEYRTGTICVSLTAAPRRARWLAAKTVTVAALGLVTGTILSIACFALVYLCTPHVFGSLTTPGVVRAVVGVGLYLCALSVLSLAVGAVLRSTVGGIVAMFALVYVVPGVVALSPLRELERFLPAGISPPNAGWTIMQVAPEWLGGLPPWAGFAVLCAWAAAAMAGATYLLHTRDA
ncbi:ABC transporter permease [Streptomyces sp. NPDC093707]|uniref:ABC transporter permease n=1 Tax=Streptomyces sp. NPDC093707 TaxID=3154984 RepID=UPI0034502071